MFVCRLCFESSWPTGWLLSLADWRWMFEEDKPLSIVAHERKTGVFSLRVSNVFEDILAFRWFASQYQESYVKTPRPWVARMEKSGS